MYAKFAVLRNLTKSNIFFNMYGYKICITYGHANVRNIANLFVVGFKPLSSEYEMITRFLTCMKNEENYSTFCHYYIFEMTYNIQ